MNGLPNQGSFPTTRWTLVASAGQDAPGRRAALESLCAAYWYPLYLYARRRCNSHELAEEHTQEFFARFLKNGYFDLADPARGRFRSFLLTSFKSYLCDASDHSRAQKRGGGVPILPFAISSGEELYEREPFHDETPERIYERRWARTVLHRVVEKLQEEFKLHGREEHFAILKPCLTGRADLPYTELAAKLNTTESAVKAVIHRLRKRYRDVLRSEVADLVSNESEIDSELRYLIGVLGP